MSELILTINNHVLSLENNRTELKKLREMLDSALTNDPTYKNHADEAKAAIKIKSATRQEILKNNSLAEIVLKIKDLTAEIKEKDAALSDYLREYQRQTGSDEIEAANGEVQEIVYVARLVKKR